MLVTKKEYFQLIKFGFQFWWSRSLETDKLTTATTQGLKGFHKTDHESEKNDEINCLVNCDQIKRQLLQ